MGITIAVFIIVFWGTHLFYCLSYISVELSDPYFYVHFFLQSYLYTGLFITAHDAMHRNISKNKRINNIFGILSSFLFAGISYKKLIVNHFKHHKNPGDENDPDFYMHSQNFLVWWLVFIKRYTTVLQLSIMAILFNILKMWFNESSVLSFWVIPAFLGTLQLFYFGTYLPHKYPHTKSMKPHNARTQKKNHLFGMLSCYFFGYHFEHHETPETPWWQLYKLK